MFLLSLFLFVDCHAQGEHSRRVAAELRVISADLQLLIDADLPKHHIRGLHQRIEGGMVALDILVRFADQELGKTVLSQRAQFTSMRDDFKANRLQNVARSLAVLVASYPLRLPDLTITDLSESARLHQSLCSGCHDHPDPSPDRPAYNLKLQAGTGSKLDMFARLLVGVRGDRITGIDNPLSDVQLVGLLEYYISGSE